MEAYIMIKGLDVGYSHTKDNEGKIFRSAYTKESVAIGKKLMIDGINYQVGSGNMNSDVDKTDNEINKVCTIYNLLISDANDLILSVGLPIGQYKSQKDKLKHSILEYNKCEVVYDNKKFQVDIKEVLVNPQGISALYSMPNLKMDGECIIVDVGGLTIDTCLVEFSSMGSKIIKCDTWYYGMRTLYSDIVAETNNKFGTKLDNIYAETILKNGYIKIKNNAYQIDYLKPILQNYIDKIAEEIKLKYPHETCPIYLVGGGVALLYSPFEKRFHDINRITNSQFANAIGYHNIAYYKYRGC